MATVPTLGRASSVASVGAPEADLTRALYEQYAAQIFRYCLHQLGSREEAEDAVQSTFLNAFRGIKRGIVPELESAWLFKIAHNVCLSRRRSTWRRGKVEAPTDFGVVEEIAPAPTRRADELIGLQDVLEEMPEQQRRAILLREWQGLSYREIGEELDLSQAAVETLIFRARRSLAQGLEEPQALQKRRKQRLGASLLGNLLSSAQSFLVGGSAAAVKVAATVAVVSAGTVVATAPARHHGTHLQTKAPAKKAPASTAAPTPRNASVQVAATPTTHAAAAVHHAAHRAARSVPAQSAGPAATPVFDEPPAEVAPPAPVDTPPAAAPAPEAQPQPPADSGPTAARPSSPPDHGRHGHTNAPAAPSEGRPSQGSPFEQGRHVGHVDHHRQDETAPPASTTPVTTTAATMSPTPPAAAPQPPVPTTVATTPSEGSDAGTGWQQRDRWHGH